MMDPPWLRPTEEAESLEIPTNFQGLDIHKYEFGDSKQKSALAEWLKHQDLPFTWDGNTTENKVASTIAYLLRQEGIPCFLWGWWAAAFLGEHNAPFEIDIVIPDGHVKKAIDLLQAKGIFGDPCTKAWSWDSENAVKLDVCSHGELFPRRPIADAHFDFYREANGNEVSCPIQIYAKSKIAWHLPDPPLTVTKDDPNYVASNSVRLPSKQEDGPAGRWLHYPSILVPRPEKFVETLIYLLCRDWRNANAYDMYWRELLHAMCEVRENPNAVVVKNIPDGPFRRFWDLFNSGSPSKNNIWRYLETVQLELKHAKELPPPPTFNFFGTEENARENGREL